jgi:hypothetical protein
VAAAAGPPGHLDGLPAAFVEAGGRGVESAAAHLVEVDAEGGQQVAVVLSWRLGPSWARTMAAVTPRSTGLVRGWLSASASRK